MRTVVAHFPKERNPNFPGTKIIVTVLVVFAWRPTHSNSLTRMSKEDWRRDGSRDWINPSSA